MEDKTKVLIFDRKEVALIFICMIILALISFSFGVKIGKSFALQKVGFTHPDIKAIELKSVEEEMAEKVMEKSTDLHSKKGDEHHQKEEGGTRDRSFKKLEEEFNKLDHEMKQQEAPGPSVVHGNKDHGHSDQKVEDRASGRHPVSALEKEKVNDQHGHPAPLAEENLLAPQAKNGSRPHEENFVMEDRTKDPYTGKYTIQLGSYQLESDAIKFADGFKVRGYNPIINEVKIEGKGMWYRVSLGTFDSLAATKEYILKEESLFQGQDYVIAEFY